MLRHGRSGFRRRLRAPKLLCSLDDALDVLPNRGVVVRGRQEVTHGPQNAALRLPQCLVERGQLSRCDFRPCGGECSTNVAQNLTRRGQGLLKGLALTDLVVAFGVLEQHLGIADDVVDRRAQIVTERRDGIGWLCHAPSASKASIFERRRGSSMGFVS